MGMQKITEGSMALEQKQRRILTIEAAEKSQAIRLRVAAYARVSSSSEDQLNSFEAQRRRYTELITSKENWAFVDLYADEGITGTSAEKRPDFQRMLADCRRGLIDRILVKSISRFARNTKECLETTRELKLLGISVRFEEQNIDTANMTGEMMTAIFASMAQAESESISGNMRWSYQKRMQAGQFNTCHAPYGYRLVNGKLVIQADEAKTIRYIFEQYLQGKTIKEISAKLGQQDNMGKAWSKNSIEYILQNERYAGNALLQKRYTTDTLPRIKKHNKGERAMYYVSECHPPIISLEMFTATQELRKKRYHTAGPEIVSGHFSKVVFCGICGTVMRKKLCNGKWYMACRTHEQSIERCPTIQVPEPEIQSAFLRLYYNLKHHGEPFLVRMCANLTEIKQRRMLWSEDIISLNRQISELTSQIKMLTKLKEQQLIDPDIYISQSNELTEQLRTAKLKKERILDQDGDTTIRDTQEILDTLEDGPDQLDAFDAELFGEIIEKVIIENAEQLRFRLRNGLELTESMEGMMR